MINKINSGLKTIKLYLGLRHGKLAAWLWGSLAALLFVCFFIFFYSDIIATLENSILLWKAAYHGEFLHYYEFGLEHISSSKWAPNYSILLYILFAVWNFPLVIADYLFQIDFSANFFAFLWCKSILLLFTLGAAILVEKTARYVNRKCDTPYLPGLGAFLALSSLNLAGPVFIIAQYDIIAVFFILCGLYSYLKRKEVHFLIFFWLAIPLKSFAVLYFIPLLLLREKGIGKILLKLLLVYSFPLLEKLIFLSDTAYPFTVGRLNSWGFQRLLQSQMELGEYSVSLFLTAFLGICLYCYLRPLTQEPSAEREAIFSTLLISAAITAFITLNTYWIVFIVPFFALAAATQTRWFKLGILLETLTGVFYTIHAVLTKGPYNYTGLVRKLVLPRVVSLPSVQDLKYGTAKEVLLSFRLDSLGSLWGTMLLFCICCIVFLYCIDLYKKRLRIQTDLEGINCGLLLAGRVILLAAFIGLLLYSNLKMETMAIYSTANGQPAQSELSLNEYEILQPFQVQQDSRASELILYFDNESTNKENFSSVEIQITDCTSNENIYAARIGANQISSAEPVVLSLKSKALTAGHSYILALKGVPGTKKGPEYHLYPMISMAADSPKLLANGITQEGSLYFEIR